DFRGQAADPLAVGLPQYSRLRPEETIEVLLCLPDGLQRLIPATLQGAAHQAILRLAGVVLPAGSIGLVPRPLDPTLPVADPLPSLPIDPGSGLEAGVQGRRPQCSQDLLGYPGLDLDRRDRLAQGQTVVRSQRAADVRGAATAPPVSHVHPVPTSTA